MELLKLLKQGGKTKKKQKEKWSEIYINKFNKVDAKTKTNT